MELLITTSRLTLEPVTEEHTQELWELFQYSELHKFVPFAVPTLEQQRERCAKWAKRQSPDGKEIWLNWAARLKTDGRTGNHIVAQAVNSAKKQVAGKVIAHFQAGIKEDGVASVGYVVSCTHQGIGLATEAMSAIFLLLKNSFSVREIKAWSDTRNEASHRVAKKLGMTQVDLLKNADFFKGSSSDEYVFSKIF